MRYTSVSCTKPSANPWMGHAIGRGDFHLQSVASTWNSETQSHESGEVRVELLIQGPDSDAFFGLLRGQREEIEREVEEPLTWYSQPGTRGCRVYARRTADITNREGWRAQHEWLRANLEKFHEVFAPRVKKLDAADLQPDGDEP